MASTSIPLDTLSEAPWSLGRFDLAKTLQEKNARWKPLGDFGKAYIGTKSGMIAAFVLSTEAAEQLRLERSLLYPYAHRGAEVNRYRKVEPGAVIIYPYRETANGTPQLIPESELRAQYPKIYTHLLSFKNDLRRRKDSRRLYAAGDDWYRHLRAGSFGYIHPAKLAFKGIATRSVVGLLAENTAFDGARCPSVIVENLFGHKVPYFLAVLNSRLLSYHFRNVCPAKLSGYIEFSATRITQAPIRVIDFDDAAQSRHHAEIVRLADQMILLHDQVAAARTGHDKSVLHRQIDATDRQIDRLVYELYDLTDEEIAIVEEATGS